MSESDKRKPLQLIGVLAVVALGINLIVFRIAQGNSLSYSSRESDSNKESQHGPAKSDIVLKPRPAPLDEAKEKAALEARSEQQKYLAKYLNDADRVRRPGSKTTAVITSSEDGKLEHMVNSALANHLKMNSVEVISSLFKPQFVSDGLFREAFEGSTAVVNKLELARFLDVLILAKVTVQYSTDASLANVMTANMQLEVVTIPITGNIPSQAWKFMANGAGFKETEARRMAEERLMKQIAADTKISLN